MILSHKEAVMILRNLLACSACTASSKLVAEGHPSKHEDMMPSLTTGCNLHFRIKKKLLTLGLKPSLNLFSSNSSHLGVVSVRQARGEMIGRACRKFDQVLVRLLVSLPTSVRAFVLGVIQIWLVMTSNFKMIAAVVRSAENLELELSIQTTRRSLRTTRWRELLGFKKLVNAKGHDDVSLEAFANYGELVLRP
ncbi:hypothetical protein F2Q69_00029277 [Brassica cretica]|uniref:Uncharacterized protein n=1 Tax=Brassica cretica TaxID=69181 RepID=A0A8S9RVZ2_BRACR|nr:hypothetical protein F2Q69_00029277 [Brassica cretica]